MDNLFVVDCLYWDVYSTSANPQLYNSDSYKVVE